MEGNIRDGNIIKTADECSPLACVRRLSALLLQLFNLYFWYLILLFHLIVSTCQLPYLWFSGMYVSLSVSSCRAISERWYLLFFPKASFLVMLLQSFLSDRWVVRLPLVSLFVEARSQIVVLIADISDTFFSLVVHINWSTPGPVVGDMLFYVLLKLRRQYIPDITPLYIAFLVCFFFHIFFDTDK